MRLCVCRCCGRKKVSRKHYALPERICRIACCEMIILLHCKCTNETNFCCWLLFFECVLWCVCVCPDCVWCLYYYYCCYYCGINICIAFIRFYIVFPFSGFLFSVLYRFSPLYYPSSISHAIIRKSIFSTFKLISNSDYHMCVSACVRVRMCVT